MEGAAYPEVDVAEALRVERRPAEEEGEDDGGWKKQRRMGKLV